MLKQIINYSKSIKGKATLMIGSFLVILFSFSLYVYIQVNDIKSQFDAYKTKWHPMQINIFSLTTGVLAVQENTEKQLFNYKIDTLNDYKNSISIDQEINQNFINRLDSLQVNWDFHTPCNGVKLFWKNIYAIRNDIAIDLSKENSKIKSDTAVKKFYGNKIEEQVKLYWGDFFGKMLGPINDGAEKLADDIKIKTYRLVGVITVFSIIISILFIYLWRKFITSLSSSLKKPIQVLEKLAKGELILEDENVEEREFVSILEASKRVSQSMSKASQFSLEIGRGNFDYQFEPLSKNDILGNSLVLMQGELKKYAQKEKETNWINVGLAKFSQILRKNNESLENMSYSFLSLLVKYTNSNQGGVFILNEENQKLELKASFAYDKQKFIQKEINIGEGFVGQCYNDADRIYVTTIPEEYIKITSGLGSKNPNVLLLVPIKTIEKVMGVIEIASFHVYAEYQISFIEKVAENLALEVINALKSDMTKRLLSDSTTAKENLQKREEEILQNMEELNAMQEESKRRELNYLEEIRKMKMKLEKYETS